MNENDLEHLCLDWFTDNGWDVSHGLDVSPSSSNDNQANAQRNSYEQVFLQRDVRAALVRLNSHLPAHAVEDCFLQVTQQLNQPDSLDLLTNNRHFHALLCDGFPVTYKVDEEPVSDKVFLIDFETVSHNRFLAVNQFTLKGQQQNRRPDVVCFINGLPVVVIELKSPTDENVDVWDAFNQLQTYKDDISNLFNTNVALVISDGTTARIGSLTANEERFMPWRTLKNEQDKPQLEWQLEYVVKGFLDKTLLLDYLRYFVLFENDGGKIIKKIAGYHQFHAVREAVRATVIAAEDTSNQVAEPRANYANKVQSGSKKAGVIWHTQGSGKSISMCCYAGKLLKQAAMKNPTLLVVTDRNDLDGQLFETFCQSQRLLKQNPVQADDRDDLRQLLAEREAGGIIFTTVQKFALLNAESHHPILNERHNIVVISDEAHRSQYGLKATINKDGKYQYGYAKYLRDALPNATFIGFTGTPISAEDRNTQAVFGDYVSIYDIQDAVDDGATVPIYYESRLAKLDLNHAEITELSEQFEELVEDEDDTALREKTKGQWSRLEKLVGAEPRIKQIAADLIQHFEARTHVIDGKAMIVAMSRDICVQLYDAIVALRPDWHDDDPSKGAIKIVMTGSAADKASLQPHIHNKKAKKDLEKRFKNTADPLKLVIVRDMWLTGFDAPCCHTMYVDKPMKGHNLMQAIARVNRVFKDKPGGLVVDYIGIANELKQALKTYTEANGRGQPTLNTEQAYGVLLEKIDVLRKLFGKTPDHAALNISTVIKGDDNIHTLLIPAANHITAIEDGKKRFFDHVLTASKAFSLCATLEQAQPLQRELAFYVAVKNLLAKVGKDDKKRQRADKNSALKRILDNAVVSEGVDDIFALCGLDKPNIGLLSDEFLEEVRDLPYKNLAVELLERLLSDQIKSKTRNNVVQEKKFAERLQAALSKYNNRAIETAQVIEELIAMAKDFQDALQRESALGLNPDEVAFYDALADNESAVRELGDELLKKIATEITQNLRKSTTVDWQFREGVRAKLRILVRRILQRYKYPPDKQLAAVELVIEQAEVLADSWTASSSYCQL